jgi:glycerol-3-phosphate cytidylyltransferase-like family protein/galactokinase/mevalonate kinase-like predicted kinase
MLHSGHVAFFAEAAQLGDLYVGIGSSKTVYELKARKTINSDEERLYMVSSLKMVKQAWISSGSGLLDFEKELRELKPDYFFVNEDGNSPEKERIAKELGIEYIVSKRIPHANLPSRSTTALRQECLIPYRIDLCGGWLDQPYVSKYVAGPVITISIEPDYDFNDRSGMATSSRKKAMELWQTNIPAGDKEKLAKTLFCFENPPGTKYVSGSQDSLGIVMPGLNKLWYDKGDYWPSSIGSVYDKEVLEWIESHLYLVPLYPRGSDYDVLENTNIDAAGAARLSQAAEDCWVAINAKNLKAFGESVTRGFDAQIAMFPNMLSDGVQEQIDLYRKEALGWKLSGAGGGGYLILIAAQPIESAIKIRIRSSMWEGHSVPR